MRPSEFRACFYFLTGFSVSDCSFIPSAVSIICSWQTIKNPGHEDTRGRIWSLKCSAWAGKYLPQGFLVCLDQAWPCPELCWPPAAEPRPPVSFLDGMLWSSGGVQVNSSFSQPSGSLEKAKQCLGLWGLKLTCPPAEQGHSLLPYQSEKWAQFGEQLQGRKPTALVEEISVQAVQKKKLLLSSWISYRLDSAGKFFCWFSAHWGSEVIDKGV